MHLRFKSPSNCINEQQAPNLPTLKHFSISHRWSILNILSIISPVLCLGKFKCFSIIPRWSVLNILSILSPTFCLGKFKKYFSSSTVRNICGTFRQPMHHSKRAFLIQSLRLPITKQPQPIKTSQLIFCTKNKMSGCHVSSKATAEHQTKRLVDSEQNLGAHLSSHLSNISLNCKGRWGTTDDFTTSLLNFSLFSTALWDLENSRPVHSLMLSSHLFLCLPCLLPLFTVPCKMVLARPDEQEIWPYHCSLCLFTMVRSSSAPIACWILAWTSLLVTWSFYEMHSILR